MNMKLRFWCPSRHEFITGIRCWTSCDGQFYSIGSCEEEVIPQLSTGCYDKNKTEIFEGDKIRYYGNVGMVGFFAGSFRVDWDDQTDDEVGTMQVSLMEVVGHRYDDVQLPPIEKDEDLGLERSERPNCDARKPETFMNNQKRPTAFVPVSLLYNAFGKDINVINVQRKVFRTTGNMPSIGQIKAWLKAGGYKPKDSGQYVWDCVV